MTYLIAPSLLAADVMRLSEEVAAVQKAGADMIHLDVMDHHYVPNLTFGPIVCEGLKKHFPALVIDVHLMTKPVDALIEDFAKAGATRISIHPDATIHLDRSLALIRDCGMLAGIALNPATPIDCIEWCQHRLDFVLVMTVNPGFGGQKLIPEVIDKIRRLHQRYPLLPIAVDGGVSATNLAQLRDAGATTFIAGSAIFSTDDYCDTLKRFRQALTVSHQ